MLFKLHCLLSFIRLHYNMPQFDDQKFTACGWRVNQTGSQPWLLHSKFMIVLDPKALGAPSISFCLSSFYEQAMKG